MSPALGMLSRIFISMVSANEVTNDHGIPFISPPPVFKPVKRYLQTYSGCAKLRWLLIEHRAKTIKPIVLLLHSLRANLDFDVLQ